MARYKNRQTDPTPGSLPSPRRKRPSRSMPPRPGSPLPDDVEELVEKAAHQIAGKPLGSDAFAPRTAMSELITRVVERALHEEMREHLGYDRYERREHLPPLGRLPGQTGRYPKDHPDSRSSKKHRSTSTEAPENKQPETRLPEERQHQRGRTQHDRNTRNGYAPKTLKTSHGSAEIRVPRDRHGSFEPRLVPKHSSISEELQDRVIAMYAAGMTTRGIADHVREMYHYDVSEMFVSRLVEQLDPELAAWRNRGLESTYAVLYIDALYLKIRHATGVATTAAYIICGYGETGMLDILGVWIAPSNHPSGTNESSTYWYQVFLELQRRGVQHVLIACSDSLTGMEDSLHAVYPEARWQPCVVHLVRASTRRVPTRERRAFCQYLRSIYQAPSYQAAEDAMKIFAARFQETYPMVVRFWEQHLPQLADLWRYSDRLRTLIYTTNPIENINRQVRAVTKNRGAFPNIDSAMRLLTLAASRIKRRNQVRKNRPDWQWIVDELHRHFGQVLPDRWGVL